MNIFKTIYKKISKKSLWFKLSIFIAFLLLLVALIYIYKSNYRTKKIVSQNISSKNKLDDQTQKRLQEINKIVASRMKTVIEQLQPDLVYKKYTSNKLMLPKISDLKGRTIGIKDPKHKMLVFMDFACGICNKVSTELKQRLEENKDRLNITYILYPLDKKCNTSVKGKYADYSCFSAELALCAEKENKFFEAFDYLYNNRPSRISVLDRDTFISEMSKNLSLRSLKGCMKSKWLKERMAIENKIYEDIKIPGTPYILIDGKHLSKVYRLKDPFSNFLDYKESQDSKK
jgi:protein-disulfide isomerase